MAENIPVDWLGNTNLGYCDKQKERLMIQFIFVPFVLLRGDIRPGSIPFGTGFSPAPAPEIGVAFEPCVSRVFRPGVVEPV